MTSPDYQGTLGFELVTVALEDQSALHLIREDGADDRDATLTERVLWSSLVEALAALNDAESILRYAPDISTNFLRYAPDISTNCMGKKPATTTAAALSKARAVLKSNGWQA